MNKEKLKMALEIFIELKNPMLVDVKEAAEILGITPRALRKKIARGQFEITTSKYGGARRINMHDLDDYLDGTEKIAKKFRGGMRKKNEQVDE